MVDRKALVARLFKLGVTYGPIAYEGVMRNRGAIEHVARKSFTRSTTYEHMAYEHAAGLVNGSVLLTFDGDTRVYVVFSGDRPVATHPAVPTPIDRLLENYDITRRLTPEQWVRENAEAQALKSSASVSSRLRGIPRAITRGSAASRATIRITPRVSTSTPAEKTPTEKTGTDSPSSQD
ncbi:hypothetical protein [Dermatophilus congolensis]|uniref:hypothetical protein n=1 Tax=Dermatophilus congolensis TaxID=1863 RepID=UPI000418280C|nr:hypothetical protein [Dermatophilus congolensis]MBO3128690.1 hypothetical protein [Dermatophilus congolensis]MBO3132673.1 hypothetical protein [Dermatophilus congolensis]MBO3133166.1 hypothetical protein [Dermatophilus congolensis]MBO3135401.1 hypothetical protein [Dermatophilus congolensis]MBO3137642.1 hypothetical protein [Dermatophilus congolensis]